MDHGAVELELTTDAARFLEQAAPLLAADPVATTVVATVTRRLVGAPPPPAGGVPRWWCAARRGAEVVGAAMRTSPTASRTSRPASPPGCCGAGPTSAAPR